MAIEFYKANGWLLVFASILLATPRVVFPSDISDVERQIENTSERLRILDRELAASRVKKTQLQQTLAKNSAEAQERDHRVQELKLQIKDFDTSLTRLEAEVSKLQQSVSSRKELLAQTLRDTRSLNQRSELKILLQQNEPLKIDRLAIYYNHVMQAQRARIEQQLLDLKQLHAARSTVLKDRNWLNYIQKKALTQRNSLRAKAAEDQTSIDALLSSIREKNADLDALQADRQRLALLLDELKREQSAQSGYFESNKGDLPYPVSGKLTAHYGDLKAVGKLTWQGIFVSARRGRPVRAVADGEILYSGRLQGFGQLVIIDHGDNYTSLYGGNQKTFHSRGTWVESGATIATVGDADGQNTSGLYFEIRHEAKALDPEKWLRQNS